VPTSPVPDLVLDTVPDQRVRTCSQSGIFRKKTTLDRFIRWGNFCITGEPENLEEAVGHAQWKEAMDEEFSALMVNKTWHLIP
jgi:hypothetical protein